MWFVARDASLAHTSAGLSYSQKPRATCVAAESASAWVCLQVSQQTKMRGGRTSNHMRLWNAIGSSDIFGRV